MAFNKRKKQPHLFRGENPFPTAEEKATGAGTHVGRVAHSKPFPTAEEAALAVAAPAVKTARVGKPKRARSHRG